MADIPKLTDAEIGYLRSLTEEIRLDVMKVHHLCEFTLGMDHITPKGREALAAYDAKQRRKIVEDETRLVDVVFDGPPGPEAGRFVEVEDDHGESICVGEWIERPDGWWALRFRVSKEASNG